MLQIGFPIAARAYKFYDYLITKSNSLSNYPCHFQHRHASKILKKIQLFFQHPRHLETWNLLTEQITCLWTYLQSSHHQIKRSNLIFLFNYFSFYLIKSRRRPVDGLKIEKYRQWVFVDWRLDPGNFIWLIFFSKNLTSLSGTLQNFTQTSESSHIHKILNF